ARDLDADNEPEVLVELYTNGAHCCTVTLIYRWDPRTNRYVSVARNWGDPGYRLAELDADGRPELVSADDRFAHEFTAFAGSALPTQIWRYDHGSFVDVTRRFPGVTKREVATLWHGYLADRKQKLDVRGVLAAWAADEELLGHDDAVWPALQAAYRRGD